tara:strand:+ start:756 stop:1499 length:744 start_codon:yes stop_codon:yes gene_type:complete
MADAYDVMSMAKRSGAQARLEEDWENYQKALEKYQARQGKASFWGGLGSMGIGKLLTKLIPGIGVGSTLADLLTAGGARGLSQFVGGEALQGLFGGGKAAPKFKSTATGPYGRAGVRGAQRQSREVSRGISEELKAGKRGRAFTSILTGLMADTDAWGDILKGDVSQKAMDETWLKGVEDNPWLIGEFSPEELSRYKDLTAPSIFETGLDRMQDIGKFGLKAGKSIFDLLSPKGYYAPSYPRYRGKR